MPHHLQAPSRGKGRAQADVRIAAAHVYRLCAGNALPGILTRQAGMRDRLMDFIKYAFTATGAAVTGGRMAV